MENVTTLPMRDTLPGKKFDQVRLWHEKLGMGFSNDYFDK